MWLFDHYFKYVGLTQIYSYVQAQELPGRTSTPAGPKVPPTKPSPSKPKAPRKLKKKAKQDPPIVFSMEEEAESEDQVEESLHRRPRKTPQAAAQVFITYTFVF